MSEENKNKKLSNLENEAVDGEKIKGGINASEPTMQMPGFEVEQDPNAGIDPAIDAMPNVPDGFTPVSNLPNDINPEMDEGLVHRKNPNAPKI